MRAGAEDDNESEDGRVFEDDLEEGDESDNHGGGGGGGGGDGKGRGGVAGILPAIPRTSMLTLPP